MNYHIVVLTLHTATSCFILNPKYFAVHTHTILPFLLWGKLRREQLLFHVEVTVEVIAASDQDSSPWRSFGQVWQERAPCGRLRTRWRDYLSQLSLKHLRIPQEELEDVAGAGCPCNSDLDEQPSWNDRWIPVCPLAFFVCLLAWCFVDKHRKD